MQKFTKNLLLILIFFYASDAFSQPIVEKCGASIYLEKMLLNEEFKQDFTKKRSDFRLNVVQQRQPICNEPLVIPVAIHYNNPITIADSDCLIGAAQAQIAQLNKDFSSCNSNARLLCRWLGEECLQFGGTAGFEAQPIDGTCIQFCLADQNLPQGEDNINGLAITVGDYSWSPGAGATWAGFLNIFVSDNVTAGHGFDTDNNGVIDDLLGIADLNGGATPNGNGVFVVHGAFGSQLFPGCNSGGPIDSYAPFDGGSSLTHEIGHFFGLDHTFDEERFGNDLGDTPAQTTPNYGCPTVNVNTCTSNGCGSNGLTPCVGYAGNFMDYVDDDCMFTFTEDQVMLMQTIVASQDVWATNSMSCYDNGLVSTYPPCGERQQGACIRNEPCPSNAIVNCADEIESGPTPISPCSDTVVTLVGPEIVGIPNCPGTTHTFTFDFVCKAPCIQIFTIGDNAAPTIICAADETVSCLADITETAPTTTTSCGLIGTVITVGPTLVTGLDNCNDATYEIVYTVTDDCSRTASCTQTFTLSNAAPTITCAADETVTCLADITETAPTTTTSCGLTGTVTTVGPTLVTGLNNCNDATYEIVYTVTDDCNRTASCTQTFTISNAAPSIICPEDCPVVCASDITPANPEYTASCGQGELTISEPIINGDPGCDGTTYTYVYTVTDECERSAICKQTFTIVNDCFFVDFDYDDNGHELDPGTIIKYQYNDFSVHTESHYQYAMIFDTGHPTSNDFDLGTPNENYGGPGIGNGGVNNTTFQGNALVVSKNKHVPNETEGKLIFNFYCSVTIKTVDLLDMKCHDSEIELYDEHHNLIAYLNIPAYGVNSFNTFDVFTSGVYTMIIDLDCGGGVTGFKYCKDNSPGALCDGAPNPNLCYDYNIDYGVCGIDWNKNATYGSVDLGLETVTIKINDEDHILEDTKTNGSALQIGIDPHDVDDQVTVCYNLSNPSNHIIFDIVDLDKKNGYSKQQEAVCVYGLLGDDSTEIYPEITSLDGSVYINGNCAEATTNSTHGDDESILVEFTDCIDKIVIEYGTGSHSPTHYPTYSKILIGESIFSVNQCKEACGCLDDDDDGICNESDVCDGFDDNIDTDNDGTPDGCDNSLRLTDEDNISISPNPVQTGSSISITSVNKYENAELLIYDELGRLMTQKTIDLLNGANKIKLPSANFTIGIYFVHVRANSFTSKVHKLMIVE